MYRPVPRRLSRSYTMLTCHFLQSKGGKAKGQKLRICPIHAPVSGSQCPREPGLPLIWFRGTLKTHSYSLTKHTRFKHFRFTKKVLFKNPTPLFEDYNEDFNLNLLLVADHSLYEAFRELALGDEFSARYALEQYLRGVYEEVRVIFNRLIFFGDRRINLHLAGTFIASRADDCPLKTLQGEMRNGMNETDFDDDYSAGNNSVSTA
uniref:Coatomer subunit zeta n=1 Tax=Steinernema glaseri TaxID=37863 RepID=A0A1I7ZFM3_9BILA